MDFDWLAMSFLNSAMARSYCPAAAAVLANCSRSIRESGDCSRAPFNNPIAFWNCRPADDVAASPATARGSFTPSLPNISSAS